MKTSYLCVALICLGSTAAEIVLPEYLEKLPSNHSAYADQHASATKYVLGAPEQGGLKEFVVVRFTKDKHVYRMFGSNNGCGYWWALDLSTSWAAYKHDNAICPEWNNGTSVKMCTVKAGYIAVVGPGQTAKCAAGNVLVAPENHLQMNRGSNSVCGDESMCYSCTAEQADLSASSCVTPGNTEYALPDYLEPLPESHEAYAEKNSSTYKFALGSPSKGNLKGFQVVKFTKDKHVYRMFGSNNACGYWWALDLSTSWAAYKHDNAICPEWNNGSSVKICTVKAGFIAVIGAGQTVRCANGNMLVPPENHFQMNRGGDSVCGDESMCYDCDAEQSDLSDSSCIAPGNTQQTLPDYLEPLPESHEAYAEKNSSTYKFAMGSPSKGNLKSFQVVKFTKDHHVYRMFGSNNGCGYWWALDLSESWAAYKHDNAICPEWNNGTKIKRCKVQAGFIAVIGVGQTVRCEAGNMLVPPETHFQMNRGGDSVCGDESLCDTCDADQSDLSASTCLATPTETTSEEPPSEEPPPATTSAAMPFKAIAASLSLGASLMH